MSIRIAGDIARIAQREAFEAAAKVADRISAKLMREATTFHDAEEPDYDRYEDLESRACLASHIAEKIRKRAKRSA